MLKSIKAHTETVHVSLFVPVQKVYFNFYLNIVARAGRTAESAASSLYRALGDYRKW